MRPNPRVTVTAAAGGEDAEDFAQLLRVMYAQWDGSLEHERGVHRLVRTSPRDPDGRRTTCFASVAVDGLADDRRDREVRSYVLYPYHAITNHYDDNEVYGRAAVGEVLFRGHLELLGVPLTETRPTPTVKVNECPNSDVRVVEFSLTARPSEHGFLPEVAQRLLLIKWLRWSDQRPRAVVHSLTFSTSDPTPVGDTPTERLLNELFVDGATTLLTVYYEETP